ncbi:MAG: hypothetical protein GX774_22645 [Armatimonadetes bacterium]|nr:hypothetical protein [Armatimonadota bacterium]
MPRCLWLAPSLGVMALLLASTGSAAELVFTREGFDALERQLGMTRTFEGATADTFAWGESYMLRGYLEMYLATRDEEYLRRLVRVADAILETRDDRKAAREGRRAAPVWSLSGHYTVARLVVKDTRGRDALLLRSIRYAYNNQTEVTVTPGAQPGTFTLAHRNEFWQAHGPAEATYTNLSLDPASPRYFERVINDPSYVTDERFARSKEAPEPASFLLVATDLRRQKRRDDRLAPLGPTLLVPGTVAYYGYLGPIFAPMTRFAALVLKTPSLQARFGEAARRYLRAARESLEAYERCWRRGPGPDEGHYLLIEKGADFWCDGIMAPFNYLGSTGQVLANLWDWQQDRETHDKLRRLANLL